MTPRVRLYAANAAAAFGTTPDALFARRLTARSDAPAYLARHFAWQRLVADGASVTQIGRWWGKHHTTVLHALGRLG